MATIVKFVSTDYVKENTIIEFNVDDSKITPIILKVQKIYLQQLVGSSFYDHLSAAVSGATLTTAETNLIRNYIQNFVAEYTVYEALPFLNYKITNKAVSKESSEFSQASDLDEIKYLRSNVKDMAEFFGTRLSKYLCDNQADFPEWNNPDTPENLPKNSRSYFNGIYLPKGGAGASGIPTYNDPSE